MEYLPTNIIKTFQQHFHAAMQEAQTGIGISQILLIEGMVLLVGMMLSRIVDRLFRTLDAHHFPEKFRPQLLNAFSLMPPLIMVLFFRVTSFYSSLFLEQATYLILLGEGIAWVWFVTRVVNIIPVGDSFKNALRILGIILILLGLADALPPLMRIAESLSFSLGETRISLWLVLKGCAVFAALVWLIAWLGDTLETSLKRQRVKVAQRTLLVKVFKIIGLSLVGLITLNSVGLDLSALTVLGGAVGIGIGFGLQTIASNFISGILLLMDRSIKPNDVISVEGTFGQVLQMRARYIVVKRRDGSEMLIPNEMLVKNPVVNWSFSDKSVRQDVDIGVAYNSDMEAIQKLLIKTVATIPRVLEKPAPRVFIKEFGDSAVIFRIRYWQEDPEEGVGNLKGDIHMAVWKALKKAGVEIPFPQRVVHLQK